MKNKLAVLLLIVQIYFICAQEDVLEDYQEEPTVLRGRSAPRDECRLESSELPNLQVLLLVDAGIPDPWTRPQREMTEEITRLLKAKYNDTVEFAAASYKTWDTECYRLLHDFTKDESLIVSAVNGVPSDPSADILSEGSMTMGMLMAMMDKNLHWIRDLYLPSTTNTRKYVVMFPTRTSTTKLPNPGNLKPPRGDGTDTCQSSLPPTGKFLHWIKSRENFFTLMNGFEPFNPAEKQKLRRFYGRFFKVSSDGWNLFLHTSNDDDGFLPEAVNKIDIPKYAAKVFKAIVEENQLCEWIGPDPYNTLGL